MKALKSTGLVPVEFLKASGPYSKGQIAGLDPAMVKKLKAGREPFIKETAIPKGEETVDIDDDTLLVVPDTPALGGYRHLPPLASDKLPGRDRLHEGSVPAGTGEPESASSPKADEDPVVATEDDSNAHAATAAAAKLPGRKSAPPAPAD